MNSFVIANRAVKLAVKGKPASRIHSASKEG